MATTAYPADVRQQVLEFAATYPAPNVRAAVRHAEAGAFTWEQIYDLFKRALANGIATLEPNEPVVVEPPRPGLTMCPNGCGHWVVEGVYIDPTLPCP